MPRIRTIKPDFWQNEDLATVAESTLLLAIGLLNHADDEGYFKANPALIKAAVFPIREPSMTIHDMITELSNVGYIEQFLTTNGRRFGRVVNFQKHQRVNRPKESEIKQLLAVTEYSVIDHQQVTPGKEGKGKDLYITPNGVMFGIRLKSGDVFEPEREDVERWKNLYRRVDIDLELSKMEDWCESNISKRKTESGIKRFITTWLGKAATDAATENKSNGTSGSSSHARTQQALEEYRQRQAGSGATFDENGNVIDASKKWN